MPMRFDPHNAALLAFLAGLQPEPELVARLAIRGLSNRCRLNGAWAARTEALRAKVVGNDADKLARIMRAAHDMADEMTTRQKQRRA
jgi:hypothetical protein